MKPIGFAKYFLKNCPSSFVKNTFTPEFDPVALIDIAREMDSENEKVNMDVFFQIDEYTKSKMWKVLQNPIALIN